MKKTLIFKGEEYTIIRLSRPVANEYIVQHHYTGKPSLSVLSLGVLKNNELIGVISYGQSVAPRMHTSLVGYLKHDEYFELQRLHVKDVTPKNFESWFISESFNWIKELYPNVKLLVSFADPNNGHAGTIYQATNWFFTGKSSNSKEYYEKKTGNIYHQRTYQKMCDKIPKDQLAEFKKGFIPIPLQGKYRYVYFLEKTITVYKNIEDNEYVRPDKIGYLENLELLFQSNILERYNGHLKCYKRYLQKDFKKKILPYPKK